jgi:lipoprotein NlpI
MKAVGSALLILGLAYANAAPQGGPDILNRAVTEFRDGRFADSAALFDALAKMAPERAPHLWQRGIALYYARRYADCRRQFESHRTVNPDDVENAAWHFLCVARQHSPDVARASLLPVGSDPREPMREVYQMFRGSLAPDEVVKAGRSSIEGQFYANLYAGLYTDSLGSPTRAIEHIRIAASDRYAAVGGYMHMVAGVHLRTLTGSGSRFRL